MRKALLLLGTFLVIHSTFSQGVFRSRDGAMKYIKGAFEMAFSPGAFKYTDPDAAGTFMFRYEIVNGDLLVVKNVLEGKPGEKYYSYVWMDVPLEDLVLLDKTHNVYKNVTNLTVTHRDGRIKTGYSQKGIHQAEVWQNNTEFYIPLRYDKIKNGLEYLTAAFLFLNESKSAYGQLDAFAQMKRLDDLPSTKESSLEIKKTYYSTGELETETSYKENKKEGVKKTYYKSGKLQKTETYKDDKKNGPYAYYWEDGKLRQSCNMTNDKFDGLLKEYFSNGQLKNESVNVAGKYEGFVKNYTETGELLWQQFFIHGKKSGTLRMCEGVAYFINILKNDRDGLLEDDAEMRLSGKNIKGFYYEFFSEGAEVLNRPSYCRLDYIDNPKTEKGWLDLYNNTRNELAACKDLEAEKEHKETHSYGMLRKQTFRYNKKYSVQVEWYKSGSKERLTLYMLRSENKD